VFVARRGRSELTNTILTEGQVRDLVEKMLKTTGRRIDLSTPFVDAMLPDGSRLHVVIPDITRKHWSVNIRKFVLQAAHLDELVELGTLTAQSARFLEAAVVAGLNIIVAGGTQAGKTTLLNCLAAAVPARERVITCEEVFELKIPLPTSWRCRPGRPTSRAPARSSCAAWSRRRCGCARPDPGRGGAAGGVPRPADRAQQRAAGHVLHPRQQRARGDREDVHAAAARRRERRPRLRRAHCGQLRRPRRPHRQGRHRPPPRARDRRRARPGRGRRRRDRRPVHLAGRRLQRADGFPPHPERFEWAGIDLPRLLAQEA
jgi:pilus assembly protein CpaF